MTRLFCVHVYISYTMKGLIRYDARYLRSTIWNMDVRTTPRLRQDHSLERGKDTRTIAQRGHRGDILDNGQWIHAIAVEFTIQANIQANIAREGAAF